MTLTQTAILTKQFIVVSIITILVSISAFIGYKIWYAHYLASLPPVEEKPDTKFGVLPYPKFPQSVVSSSNFSYSLDTTTGGLPKIGIDPGFDKLVKVYFMIKPYATFLSPDKSQALAGKFGITSPPEVINETTYSFKQDSKSLIVDLNSGNFQYKNGSTPSALLKLDDDNKLVADFENILQTLGVLKDDIKNGRNKVIPLRLSGNDLVLADQRSDAVAGIVSLWSKSLDKKPVITSDYSKSLINATIINSAAGLDNYLSLNFTYFQIDENTFATYPTKTADDAYADLKNGKGIILVQPNNPQVSITFISLGYFVPDDYSPYIQPVYVFEGPQFAALVPAVNNQFLKNN